MQASLISALYFTLSTQACVQQQPARHLPAPPSATGNGAAAHQPGPVNGTAAALNGNGNGSSLAAPAVSSEFQKIQAAVAYIRSRCSLKPEVVLVLGSGLGPIADEVQDATVIPYAEVPHFHAPAVQGHPGRLVLGKFNGVPALVLQVRWGQGTCKAGGWEGGGEGVGGWVGSSKRWRSVIANMQRCKGNVAALQTCRASSCAPCDCRPCGC
jgi:hypothetical protein